VRLKAAPLRTTAHLLVGCPQRFICLQHRSQEPWTRFDSQTYIRWLKNQFSEYRVVAETDSALTLAKQLEADSYTLEVTVKTASSGMVAHFRFVAEAD